MKETVKRKIMDEISYRELFNLKGRVAIVTGGAGILGQQFCKGLAELGANVAVVDVDGDRASDLATSICARYKVQSLGFNCDVTNSNSVKETVSSIVKEFGEINILHNNAAGKSEDLDAFFNTFEEYEIDQWKQIMSVNVDGMFLVAQSVGKQMIAQGKGGSIIQTSSIYGVVAPDARIYENSFYLERKINTPAVYSASKAAVIGLTKYLAAYWGELGIRVNTLTPGGVESGQNNDFIKRYSDRVPMNRMANKNEMVGALLYLASDASSYVTGQNIIVDGGLTCW